jgi:chemotaxis response regulator CheB
MVYVMRILIAEDDEALARFVRQGLEAERSVDVFSDGEQARNAATEFEYGDLITKIRDAAQSRKPHPVDVLARKPPKSQSEDRDGLPLTTPAIVALGTSTGGPKAVQDILPLMFRSRFSSCRTCRQDLPHLSRNR